MITGAERERRLYHIRGALVDLRNSYVDRPWWYLSVRWSKRLALAEEAIRMLDAMIHTERMNRGRGAESDEGANTPSVPGASGSGEGT